MTLDHKLAGDAAVIIGRPLHARTAGDDAGDDGRADAEGGDGGLSRRTQKTTIVEEPYISDTLLMSYLKRWRPEYRDGHRVEHKGASRLAGFDVGKLDAEISAPLARFVAAPAPDESGLGPD